MANRYALLVAVLNNDSRTTAFILKSFKEQHPRRQERIVDELWVPATSCTAEPKVVQEHFRGLLNGSHTSLKAILDKEGATVIDKAEQTATIVRGTADFPTGTFIVRRHAASKSGKGFSESLMAPEAHKTWPQELARLTHPMHTKSVAYISRPL